MGWESQYNQPTSTVNYMRRNARDLQDDEVWQLDGVLSTSRRPTAFPRLAMLQQGILQVSRKDIHVNDVLCAIEGQDEQIEGGGWGHGGRQCETAMGMEGCRET